MPRSHRITPAGFPAHVVQRGIDRRDCFRLSNDYKTYLQALEEAAAQFDVDVHAYALMTNHIHLLITPWGDKAISNVMQQIGRRYVSYFNRKYARSGGLWEGRFYSSLIETDRYLLACQRYIELNPVRAGIVPQPSHYPWSSYRANALGEASDLVRRHSVWKTLGRCPEERRRAYRHLFSDSLDVEIFRHASRKGLPVGSDAWRSRLEGTLGVRFGSGRRGRPRKKGV